MSSDRRVAAIVLAAGEGRRLGAPKQFLLLAGHERLVDRSVAEMAAVVDWTVLVLPPATAWSGAPVDRVVQGGSSRLDSVRAALDELPDDIGVVLITDAAHPLATAATARSTIAAVDAGADAAVPWLEAADVVKRRFPDATLATIGRDGIGLAQVPMAFRRSALDAAHRRPHDGAWEDTDLIERDGGRIVAVAGDPGNIHVVDHASLAVARALAQDRSGGSNERT